MKITPFNELPFADTWKFMFYGKGGTGKTRLACTSKLRMFIFDVDGGLVTAQAYAKQQGRQLNGDVCTVKTYQDFIEGVRYFDAHKNDYELVVVDSATHLQGIYIIDFLKKSGKTALDHQGWGDVLRNMNKLAEEFRHLPMHVIWTAHDSQAEDPNTGQTMWAPAFQGQFRGISQTHFSVVGRLQKMMSVSMQQVNGKTTKVTNVDYMINFGPDATVETKDRSNTLSRFEEPNLEALIAKINAGIENHDHDRYGDAVEVVEKKSEE